MTESHATLRTHHDRSAVVAAAVSPDNTTEMRTRVEEDRVITEIERNSTGGLRASATDYIANVRVADEIATMMNHHQTHQS